jgi:hypothetical protein
LSKLEDIMELRLAYMGSRPESFIAKSVRAIIDDINTTFLLIDRDELPKAAIVSRGGQLRAEVAGSASTWPVKSTRLDNNWRWGLEYLAAVEAVRKHHADQETVEAKRAAKLTKRRDELAELFSGVVGTRYDLRNRDLRNAIDRIIELEGKQA